MRDPNDDDQRCDYCGVQLPADYAPRADDNYCSEACFKAMLSQATS